MKITDVAVAILLKPDGSFLLASRPEGKPYPHYWEFPGGKIEAGETVREALVRELQEELDITATDATPWFTFLMHYTHATVRLHCWRVFNWNGELKGMEGQAFSWQRLDALMDHLTVSPTLPGCQPIFRALRLPTVYAISNAGEMGEKGYLEHLRGFWSSNGRKPFIDAHFCDSSQKPLLQIREKSLTGKALESFARNVLELAQPLGVKVLINQDIDLAERIGADGVHLTATQLHALLARPSLPLVGASVHHRDDLERAAALCCDFAIWGAVKATKTHPGQSAIGWSAFADAVRDTPIPCFALGGLSHSDFETAIRHGAQGIALQRGFGYSASG